MTGRVRRGVPGPPQPSGGAEVAFIQRSGEEVELAEAAQDTQALNGAAEADDLADPTTPTSPPSSTRR